MPSSVGISGSGNESVILDFPIDYIVITASFAGLLFSSDKEQTFISVPVGTHSFEVGITNQIHIQSEQDWTIIAKKA